MPYDYRTYLFDLEGFRECPSWLQIENLSNSRLGKSVVIAANALDESKFSSPPMLGM
jgi:hypothetical protein